MADFPQTQNTGNLQKFIREIPSRGVPDKVTTSYIESIGYKSKNDRTIPSVLKYLGILESNGVPVSPIYARLRHKEEAGTTLASLIRKSYPELFSTYPNANAKDSESLKTWFTSKTSVGAASVKNITQTFLALCSLADWDGSPNTNPTKDTGGKQKTKGENGSTHGQNRVNTQVAFNIQVQIPGDQTPEVYESIFKNLGKYVLGNIDE